MLRRILIGAAIAGIALLGSATSASATGGPGPLNHGNNLAGQLSVLEESSVLNGIANHVLNKNNIVTLVHLNDIGVDLLSSANHY